MLNKIGKRFAQYKKEQMKSEFDVQRVQTSFSTGHKVSSSGLDRLKQF